MQMTNDEIKRSYREAKHKNTQIQILADLNCCEVEEIEEILGLREATKAKIPQSIARMAAVRLEELEKIINEATNEYKEISQFLGMGA